MMSTEEQKETLTTSISEGEAGIPAVKEEAEQTDLATVAAVAAAQQAVIEVEEATVKKEEEGQDEARRDDGEEMNEEAELEAAEKQGELDVEEAVAALKNNIEKDEKPRPTTEAESAKMAAIAAEKALIILEDAGPTNEKSRQFSTAWDIVGKPVIVDMDKAKAFCVANPKDSQGLEKCMEGSSIFVCRACFADESTTLAVACLRVKPGKPSNITRHHKSKHGEGVIQRRPRPSVDGSLIRPAKRTKTSKMAALEKAREASIADVKAWLSEKAPNLKNMELYHQIAVALVNKGFDDVEIMNSCLKPSHLEELTMPNGVTPLLKEGHKLFFFEKLRQAGVFPVETEI